MISRLAAAISVGFVLSQPPPVAAQGSAAGIWVGEATVPSQNLTIRFDIRPTDSGIGVVMDIPESKLIGFPAPKASLDNNRLHVEVPPGWGLAMFRDIGLLPE